MNKRNFSHNSNFVFVSNLFNDNEVEYLLQGVNLPGISFNHIGTSTSSTPLFLQGDTPMFNDLNLSFILDEELKLWKEIMIKFTKMRDSENSFGDNEERWGRLLIQNENASTILIIEFHNLRIESISDIYFNSNQEDDELFLDMMVKYDYFTVIEVPELEDFQN